MDRCRFTTSWGGVLRCPDPVDRLGFCRFHHDCYRRGEIDVRGVISERISDQKRRRAINFHGLRPGSGQAA
ncbi:MAG TPA: hypothetical protein VFT43_12560 [Candidatus Polarisedimenticolia bacterium]|nr:hypothetical protein [Candidatus Polarisedimenticolia bacterium]